MPSWLDGKPFAITFAVLFGIVLLRAQATYWLGRGVTTGALHTPLAAKLISPKDHQGDRVAEPLGPAAGHRVLSHHRFQTVVNAAAGLIRMPWVRYTIAMLIGCVAWAAIYATVGIAAVEGMDSRSLPIPPGRWPRPPR